MPRIIATTANVLPLGSCFLIAIIANTMPIIPTGIVTATNGATTNRKSIPSAIPSIQPELGVAGRASARITTGTMGTIEKMNAHIE